MSIRIDITILQVFSYKYVMMIQLISLFLQMTTYIRFIKLGTFFALKSQGGGRRYPPPLVTALDLWEGRRGILIRVRLRPFHNFLLKSSMHIAVWTGICFSSLLICLS